MNKVYVRFLLILIYSRASLQRLEDTMAPSEYEQYLEQAPNKRGDWPGEYADIDTYLI